MAEETAVVEQKPETQTPVTKEVLTPEGGFWDDNSWSNTPPVLTQQPNAADGGAVVTKEEKPTTTAEPDEEIVDELEYLEKQTGYKSWDEIKALKTEAEQLRAKAQTPAEIKFANETSQKLFEAWKEGKEDEVYNLLHTQRELKRAAELPSADAIRMHIKMSNEGNPNFKAADVEDIFEDRYGLPKEPRQRADEDPEDFQDRMTEYKTRVEKVNRAIERDAFTAKQELAKRITELKPPEIQNHQQMQQGPPPEVLEARKAFVENYRKEVPKQVEGFKGFSTTFKDDTVEIPISYGISPEELKETQTELEEFADKGLDVNQLFSKDWVNPDGTVNIRRMAEDRYLLKNRDKIFQKIANESGAKRLAHQMKLNSNIKVDGKTQTAEIKKDENAAILDHFWNA